MFVGKGESAILQHMCTHIINQLHCRYCNMTNFYFRAGLYWYYWYCGWLSNRYSIAFSVIMKSFVPVKFLLMKSTLQSLFLQLCLSLTHPEEVAIFCWMISPKVLYYIGRVESSFYISPLWRDSTADVAHRTAKIDGKLWQSSFAALHKTQYSRMTTEEQKKSKIYWPVPDTNLPSPFVGQNKTPDNIPWGVLVSGFGYLTAFYSQQN